MNPKIKIVEEEADELRNSILRMVADFEKKHSPFVQVSFDNDHPKKVIVAIDLEIVGYTMTKDEFVFDLDNDNPITIFLKENGKTDKSIRITPGALLNALNITFTDSVTLVKDTCQK